MHSQVAEQLVSICIPVYNGGKYLEECLRSCLAQTYAHFEVIVCDDCSTDNSGSIVRAFMATDPRISYSRNEQNVGLVSNWNKCITLAKGTWIKMLFQDDYLSKDCLEQFMRAADNGIPLMVSRRNFIFAYEPGKTERNDYRKKSMRFDRWARGRVAAISPERLASTAAKNININFIGEPSLTMFSKQAAIDTGLFDKDFLQVCDLDFLLRMAAVKGLVYLPYDLCFFRLHAEATTNQNMSNRGFELRYLEPLLMATRLLAHRSYAPLKDHLTAAEKFRIRLYLNTRLMEAKIIAQRNGNTDLLDSYLLSHPSIALVAKPQLIHRLVFLLLRLKRRVVRLGRND